MLFLGRRDDAFSFSCIHVNICPVSYAISDAYVLLRAALADRSVMLRCSRTNTRASFILEVPLLKRTFPVFKVHSSHSPKKGTNISSCGSFLRENKRHPFARGSSPLCASVHVCVYGRVCAQTFWTGPGVKGSANTLSLSAARVITPGWNYSTFVYKLPWAHCK